MHRIAATAVFLVSFVQLLLTAQPSVSFWDPGELSAAAFMLQVPHPPGGPLFLLIGRLFYMLPFPGNIGFRMNMVSVLSSAVSVLFLYLIAVKAIRGMRRGSTADRGEDGATCSAAAIGALAFSFSDTFWFSGVESNYFAFSTFLFSCVVWVMMIWGEKAEDPGNQRYLILIAYLIGLSAGVHLMSVLTVVAVGMVLVFKRYITDDRACRDSALVLVGHSALLIGIAAVMWIQETSQQPPSIEEAHSYDMKFVVTMAVASAVVAGLFRKKVFTRNSIYFAIAVGGVALFVTYPVVIKLFPAFLLRVAGDDVRVGAIVLLAVMAGLLYASFWAGSRRMPMLRLACLCMLVAIVGFTTYSMILIRSNQNPPMNENRPQHFSGLVKYLDREQYGDFPLFKRRWSEEPQRQKTFSNYSSDLDFFWRYQMNHMFNRYMLWNFVGRDSMDQDAGVNWKDLFAVPLALGLIGLYIYFKRDWKMAAVFLILFIFMGYLIAFYQNQQEPQPRDRDYFYPGAYFIFSLWIAIGVKGLIEVARGKLPASLAKPALYGIAGLAFLFIPVRMVEVNYRTHDRSRNWIAWDLSYNMLQTCEKDAILFTNGDNDTFPLWYLQDVEGIRRDVRIVNLSLANTPWYIQQLKEKPYYSGALPVAMSIPDAKIPRIQPMQWEPREIDLPLSPETIRRFGVTDTAVLRQGKVSFLMRNTYTVGATKIIQIQDIVVLDIVTSNQWKRPIYFSTTCPPESKIGLDEYFWFRGLAWKLEPRRISQDEMGLDPGILEADLMHEPAKASPGPQAGYLFRSIADPRVSLDDSSVRIMLNYRLAFRALALHAINIERNREGAVAVLERMESLIPRGRVPLSWDFALSVAGIYRTAGRLDRFDDITAEIETSCRKAIAEGNVNMNSYYNPYGTLLEIYEIRKEYAKIHELLKSLETLFPDDSGLKKRTQDVEVQMRLQPGT